MFPASEPLLEHKARAEEEMRWRHNQSSKANSQQPYWRCG